VGVGDCDAGGNRGMSVYRRGYGVWSRCNDFLFLLLSLSPSLLLYTISLSLYFAVQGLALLG
jgi:hypothetical protein